MRRTLAIAVLLAALVVAAYLWSTFLPCAKPSLTAVFGGLSSAQRCGAPVPGADAAVPR
jgi:hypothetical protein